MIRPPRCFRWGALAAALALLPSLAAAAPTCKGVTPYRGLPLHEPPAAEQFPAVEAGLPAPAAFDPALAESLEAACAWILERSKAPALTAAVLLPDGSAWSTNLGLADAEAKTPLPPDAIFYWGSVGKTFTGMLVLQLIEEGKLAYDAKLSTWFPDVVNAEFITIDMLLTHTHGIFSFQADSTFHFTPGYSPPETLLAVAARHDPVHCPGEAWSYSNTGYVLLARILEKIEDRPYHVIARERIVRRLDLASTAVLAPRESPANLVPGHRDGRPDRAFDPSMPYGAGGVAASAADMVRFWRAALTGELVGAQTIHDAFARLYPMFGSRAQCYGRAVMLYDVPAPEGTRTWLGHSGGTETAKAIVLYDVPSGAYVAVGINAAVPAEAAAFRLVRELPVRP